MELPPNPFKDEREAPQVTDGKIHIKPWIEKNDKRGSYSGGIQVGMSIDTLKKILGKLKFWGKNKSQVQYECIRCKSDVINGRCNCLTSPSPWKVKE